MSKKIIFTCITGDYDRIPEVKQVTPGWEYLLFTDKPAVSDVWRVIQLPETENPQLHARRVKIMNTDYLDKGHDISIWIDGRIDVNCNLDRFVKVYHRNLFSALKHPHRITTSGETDACIRLKKCNPVKARHQFLHYQTKGYCDDKGLYATGLLVRQHNESVQLLMEAWWKELMRHTLRDQLSLPYVAWDYGMRINAIPWNVLSNEFSLRQHWKNEVQR